MTISPAEQLEGVELNGQWKVEELLSAPTIGTGGNFSCQYIARDLQNSGTVFLKAIDVLKRPRKNGIQETLDDWRRAIGSFQYEQRLLEVCNAKKMDRIVRALDHGIFEREVNSEIGKLTIPIPFLVFELAEADARTHPNSQKFDLSWRLTIFHGAASALNQLHSAQIAHQDLKPSNVMIFEKDFAKLGDLGRSTFEEDKSKYDLPGKMAGDQNYIPFELMYSAGAMRSWEDQKFGADFFMLGALLCYLVADTSFHFLVMSKLDKQFWPHKELDYARVVPHLQLCTEAALKEIEETLPKEIAVEVCSMIYRLCNPDYTKRGWQAYVSQNGAWAHEESGLGHWDLQQIISRSDVLMKRAKILERRGSLEPNKTPFLDWFSDQMK